MPSSAGPNTAGESNLVFAYDLGDVVNSYKGEPTTNTVRYSNNVTGSNYGYNDEYEPCQLVKTWIPSLPTPLGYGATQLTQQAVNSYLHCLNWFDSDEDGKRCLSAFIFPLTSGITNLFLGMVADGSNGVFFNLDTLAITYGGGISNTNAFITPVIGYPGWYRVGANIEGRPGGWVASFGIGQNQQYTPSAPFKSFYLCGLQYERGGPTHVTQPLPSLNGAATARSVTQGLLPLVGSTSIDLTNVSFDNNAQMIFDGTDDNIALSSTVGNFGTNDWSISCWWKSSGTQDDYASIISQGFIYPISAGGWSFKVKNSSGENFLSFSYGTAGEAITNLVTSAACNDGNWHNLVAVKNVGTVTLYMDGVSVGSSSPGPSLSFGTGATTYLGYTPRDAAYLYGYLNNFTTYNRALSGIEVSQNYNAIKSRFNIT